MILQISLPTIQAGTILIAAATFFGALVGALTQFYIRKQNEKKEKRNLRAAFLGELKAASDHTDAEIMSFEHMVALVSTIPTEIYEQNTDRLGILETNEVDALVKYYSIVETAEGKLEFDRTEYEDTVIQIEKVVEEGILPEEKKEKGENLLDRLEGDISDTLDSYKDTLDRKRKSAIQSIEENYPS